MYISFSITCLFIYEVRYTTIGLRTYNKSIKRYLCQIRCSQTGVDEDSSILDCPEKKAAEYLSVISLPVAMMAPSCRCELRSLSIADIRT